MPNYNDSVTFLGKTVTVIIDRPLGSRHPEWGFVYPVNYGYIPGQRAPDGEPLDAYVLGIEGPLTEFTGICVAVVHRLDDVEDKLVVVPLSDIHLTRDEISAQIDFQERYFKTIIFFVLKNGIRPVNLKLCRFSVILKHSFFTGKGTGKQVDKETSRQGTGKQVDKSA